MRGEELTGQGQDPLSGLGGRKKERVRGRHPTLEVKPLQDGPEKAREWLSITGRGGETVRARKSLLAPF